MPRPLGSKNLEVPDPPFEFAPDSGGEVVITPSKDKKGVLTYTVSINGAQVDGVTQLTLSAEEMEDFEVFLRVSNRWATKVQKEQEKIQKQIDALNEKLAFLRR